MIPVPFAFGEFIGNREGILNSKGTADHVVWLFNKIQGFSTRRREPDMPARTFAEGELSLARLLESFFRESRREKWKDDQRCF
jgi:hypothetical protein